MAEIWGIAGKPRYDQPSPIPQTQYPAAPPVTQPQTYTPTPMAQMAQNYWQQQANTPIYTQAQQAGLENRQRNILNTGLAAEGERAASQFGAGGQSGAYDQYMRDLALRGVAGQQNIMANVGMDLAGQEAQRRMGLAQMGFGGAGTLGQQGLNEWQQTQYQPYQDAMSQNLYYAQLSNEEAWKKKLLGLMNGNVGNTGGFGMSTAPSRSYY